MKQINKLIGLIVGLCFFVQASAQSYDVSVRGLGAGEASFSLVSDGHTYRAMLKLYPNMLAKMAGIGDWVDSSQGKITKGHFQPSNYQRTDGNDVLLSVNFSGNKAHIRNKDGKKTLTIKSMGQDPMSQIAQIQYDLKHNKVSPNYYLITDRGQRLYTSQVTKKGNATRVVLTQAKGGERVITLWFNQQLQLSRMKKTKRGKTDFDMKQR